MAVGSRLTQRAGVPCERTPMQNAIPLPEKFVQAMRDLYGADGEAWMGRLPALIRRLEERWSLRAGPPFDPLSYNYVAPATREGGAAVVLKLGFPGRERNKEFYTEIDALRIFDGRGICRLLDSDPDEGAMLARVQTDRLIRTPGPPQFGCPEATTKR